MADRVITAEALITAKDGTGDTFAKIGAKLSNLGNSARSSKQFGELCDRLDATAKKIQALDKLQANMAGFAKVRKGFNESKVALEAHARAMKLAERPTAEMERKYTQLQGAVTRAAAAFEKQKNAMLDSKRAADALGAPVTRIVAEQERLKAVVEQTTKAFERQVGAEKRMAAVSHVAHRIGHGIKHATKEITPLVAGGAGFETLEGVKEAAKEGAEVNQQRVHMRYAVQMPESEIAAADRQSAELAARYPNVSRSQILENYQELRSVFQDKEDTPRIMPTLIQARSAMTALDPSGKGAEGLKYAVKGAEILGRAKDAESLRDCLDGFIRSQQVMGSTARSEDLGAFAKYTKSSGKLLSNRFLYTTANSLIQEESGKTAGLMTTDVVKEMTGGFEGYQSAAKQLIALGLADDKDFNHNKQGDVHGLKPRKHIKDWRLWQSDPDRAVWEKLVPAMEAHGITSEEEQVATARRLFPNSLAADFVAKLIQQRQSFENHSKQYAAAGGIDAGQNLEKSDALAGFQALTTSLKSLAGTLTDPIMGKAAGVMDSWAHTIGGWGQALQGWEKNHPDAAKWLAGGGLAAGGALGYGGLKGLMSGFGLDGSAKALDASAVALSEAAVKLMGGKGGLPTPGSPGTKAVEAAEGEAVTAAETGAGGVAAGGTLGWLGKKLGWVGRVGRGAVKVGGKLGEFAGPAGMIYSFYEALSYLESLKPPPPNLHGPAPIEKKLNGYIHHMLGGWAAGNDAPEPSPQHPAAFTPMPPLRKAAAHSPYGSLDGARAAYGTPPALPPAISGPITAVVDKPIDVTGKVQLQGQGNVAVTVKVDGGGTVTKQIATSSGNIKVSTGPSMSQSKSAAAGSASNK